MKARTPAEEQMEELRRLRESAGKRKATAPARPKTAAESPASPKRSPAGETTAYGGLELSEVATKAKKAGPSLAMSKELYRQLMERQRQGKSFKRRKDMGDWGAQLILSLPFEAHKLSTEAKADLFKRMQEWARARGLE